MHCKKLLVVLLISVASCHIFAQDYHFTQFYMSPMTLNPAQTGQFSGTARIGGIYRDQYGSVIKDQFSTPSAYVDAPIIRGFRKKDWVGVGAAFVSDKAGAAALTRTTFALSGAYHLALDKKGNTYLSVGGQYGIESRGINRDRLQMEDHLLTGKPVNQSNDYNKIRGGEDEPSFADINGGVQLTAKLNKKMDVNIGYAMYHIGRSNYSLISGSQGGGFARMPRRSVIHGRFNVAMNDKITISPTFLYQTMAGADEIMVQGLASYLFNEKKGITLQAGLSYRLADALNISPIVGMRYKDLHVGLAYDINTGSLADVSARGGFELAVNYIIKIYKPSVNKPRILCPRF
jgi:type IX secretion system PorP/SprF family membrane protein